MKFHAVQSIVVFGGLTILHIAIGIVSGIFGGLSGLGAILALGTVTSLFGLVICILLVVKAYRHQNFHLPIAAGVTYYCGQVSSLPVWNHG